MFVRSVLPLSILLSVAFGAPSTNEGNPYGFTKRKPFGNLNPKCAPGCNFDMSVWSLQLPIGDKGHPDTISSSDLQGASGYQDPGHRYFYTNNQNGALTMRVPGSPSSSGCVTTTNSEHCRTELREVDPSSGDKASWDPNAAKNRLKATVAVVKPDDSQHGTVIGQIHIDDKVSSKPVCELFHSSYGDISMGVEQTRGGGNLVVKKVGHVQVGARFTYEIRYEKNVLSVKIDSDAAKKLSTFSLNAPASYFKAGNYNQGDSSSTVEFFAISVTH